MVPYKTNAGMVAISDFYTYPDILRMLAVARTVPFCLILSIVFCFTCLLKQYKIDYEFSKFNSNNIIKTSCLNQILNNRYISTFTILIIYINT